MCIRDRYRLETPQITKAIMLCPASPTACRFPDRCYFPKHPHKDSRKKGFPEPACLLEFLHSGTRISPQIHCFYTGGCILTDCIGAVSYTHLDVYKRQILDSGNYTLYDDAVPVLKLCIDMGYKNYILSKNYPELSSVAKEL